MVVFCLTDWRGRATYKDGVHTVWQDRPAGRRVGWVVEVVIYKRHTCLWNIIAQCALRSLGLSPVCHVTAATKNNCCSSCLPWGLESLQVFQKIYLFFLFFHFQTGIKLVLLLSGWSKNCYNNNEKKRSQWPCWLTATIGHQGANICCTLVMFLLIFTSLISPHILPCTLYMREL